MSEETPAQFVPPGAPAFPPPNAAQAYSVQNYAYRAPTRPRLTPRTKRGAFWAGAVGFNVLSVGFGIAMLPVVAAIVGAFFSLVVNRMAQSDRNSAIGARAFRAFFDSLDYGFLSIIGVVAVILGLLIMAAGLFASVSILKGHGARRPWPISWAGAGIAIVANGVVGWIAPFAFQLVVLILIAVGVDSRVSAISQGGLVVIGLLVGNTIIGWLSWWWMAHAMRPREVDSAPVAEPTKDEQE
jgi:hypothetical protein